MKFWSFFILTLSVLALPTNAFAGENRKTERVEIAGGIGPARLSRMWATVKSQCYEMGYTDIIEEKEIKTIICKQDNLNLFVKFDATGFVIKADALFAKMPVVGGIFSSPRKHRRKLVSALQAVI